MIKIMDINKERILLVEHDPEISDLICRQTLLPLGYRVEVVGGAAPALQEAIRYAPDLIIANLSLPGLSGKDLLVGLSSQGVEAPIIVIAPRGMESDVIQAFRLGAADFLSWPIREAEVVSAVERILKQVRSRRERELLARQLTQTNQELQRRVRELTTIFAIGKAVISATDQQTLFNKIMEGSTYVAEANSGWLLVRDERSKAFTLKAYHNVPSDIAARVNQPWDDGLSSLVALSGESLSIHGDPLKRFKVTRLGQSALVVPVKVKKEVIGLLVVARKEAQPFSSSQQTLLEAVADYASISMVNARLFKALEERVRSLQESADNTQVNERINNEALDQVIVELSNPLKEIKANVVNLQAKDLGKLNTEQSQAIDQIEGKLKTVLEIIESMRAIKKNDGSMERIQIDMNELARQAVSRLQPFAQLNSTTLTAELPPKPVFARGDPAQVAKVFDSLLTNAIKYCLKEGLVITRVESLSEETTRVTFAGNGMGIDPDNLPYIFDKAYHSEAASAGRLGGVGISLTRVKEIIQSHGGKVWAENQSTGGATFYFTLPTSNQP